MSRVALLQCCASRQQSTHLLHDGEGNAEGVIQQCMSYLTPGEAQVVACTGKKYFKMVEKHKQWPDWLQERFGYTVHRARSRATTKAGSQTLTHRKVEGARSAETKSPEMTNSEREAYRLFCQLMMAHHRRETARLRRASLLSRSRTLRRILDALFFMILPIVFTACLWKASLELAWHVHGAPFNGIVNPLVCAWGLLVACVIIHKCLDQWVPVPGELSILDHQNQGNELSIPWLVSSLLENSVELEFSVDWTSKTVFSRRAYCPGARTRWAAACVIAALVLLQLMLLGTLPEERDAADALHYLTPSIFLTLATTILPMAVVPGEWRCYSFPRAELYLEVWQEHLEHASPTTRIYKFLQCFLGVTMPLISLIRMLAWAITTKSADTALHKIAAHSLWPAAVPLAVSLTYYAACNMNNIIQLRRFRNGQHGEYLAFLFRDTLRRLSLLVTITLAVLRWDVGILCIPTIAIWMPECICGVEGTVRVLRATWLFFCVSRQHHFVDVYRTIQENLGYHVHPRRSALQ